MNEKCVAGFSLKWVFIFHDISNHCDTKYISKATVRSYWMCWTCFPSSRSLFGESQPVEQEGASPAWVSARKRRTPRSCSSPSRGSSAAERLSHNLTRQRPTNMSANYRRAGCDFWLNYKEFLLIEMDFIWYDLKYETDVWSTLPSSFPAFCLSLWRLVMLSLSRFRFSWRGEQTGTNDSRHLHPSTDWPAPDRPLMFCTIHLPADSVWSRLSGLRQPSKLWTRWRLRPQWFPRPSPSPAEIWAVSVRAFSSQRMGRTQETETAPHTSLDGWERVTFN